MISGDLWAGAEVMDYRLLKGLQEFKNLELSAILLNEGKLAEEIRGLRIPVAVMDETRLNIFQILGQVRKTIKRTSPHIIHSHRQKENIIAYLSSRNSSKRIQLISTQHGLPEPLNVKFKIIKDTIVSKYNFHILSTYFRYVIAVSEDVRNYLYGIHGIPKGKIIVIHNGTEITHDYSVKMDMNDYVIGSSGRMFPIKDYPLMVAIAHEVLKNTGNVRFELAGEGPERENILRLIHDYRIEKAFILRGFLDNMTEFYNGLDLYINTSLHEGLPMSILEAMSRGLPVIAPNIGGLKEIVNDGLQGYLINGRDPELFAEKCLRLYLNKELSKRMGTASIEKIKSDFSLEKMAQKYNDLYLGTL